MGKRGGQVRPEVLGHAHKYPARIQGILFGRVDILKVCRCTQSTHEIKFVGHAHCITTGAQTPPSAREKGSGEFCAYAHHQQSSSNKVVETIYIYADVIGLFQ